jgi:hypothetical protein
LGFILSGSVIGVLLVSFWRTAAPRVSRESFEKITVGMSYEDVTALLGSPPGDKDESEEAVIVDLYGGGVMMMDGEREEWWGREGVVQIGFDDDGRVLWTRFVATGLEERVFWDHLLFRASRLLK